VSALRPQQAQWVMLLRQPPVAHAAQALWYEGKVLALLAEFCFRPSPEEEFFCDRQKRLARERVQKAIAVLRENPAEPPDLEGLGRRVGCSPFYLSRTFSAELGMTIPQYVRQLRMERAAELLRSGKFNVTEAALEVGYSSLSHFSQAFHETFGCCPGLYPVATPSQKLAVEKRANPGS
jgi:AraC-like DNA-binding protein